MFKSYLCSSIENKNLYFAKQPFFLLRSKISKYFLTNFMESTFFTLKTNQEISKQTTHKYIDCNPLMFFKDITKSHYLKMLIKFFFRSFFLFSLFLILTNIGLFISRAVHFRYFPMLNGFKPNPFYMLSRACGRNISRF